MALEEANPLDSASCRLLTVSELCLAFGVSRDWVYKHANNSGLDHLPCVRLGRLVRFKHSEVSRYIEARQRGLPGASLAATDGIVRAKERRKMARCHYQNGCLFVRGKRRKVWVARWREDVILADGSTSRVMRSAVLGLVSEIKGRREARRLLDARLNHFNKVQ